MNTRLLPALAICATLVACGNDENCGGTQRAVLRDQTMLPVLGDTSYVVLERTLNPKDNQVPTPFEIVRDVTRTDSFRLELEGGMQVPEGMPPRPILEVRRDGDTLFVWYSRYSRVSAGGMSFMKGPSSILCEPVQTEELTLEHIRVHMPLSREAVVIDRRIRR